MEVIIQYKVPEERLDELKIAREKFFNAEREVADPETSYRALAYPDGVSFVHVAKFENEAAKDRFQATEHFAEWAKALKELCEEGPKATPLVELDTTTSDVAQ